MIITGIICLAKNKQKNGIATNTQKQAVHMFNFCPQKTYPTNVHVFVFFNCFSAH